jgi:hypothetical protein
MKNKESSSFLQLMEEWATEPPDDSEPEMNTFDGKDTAFKLVRSLSNLNHGAARIPPEFIDPI